MIKKLFLILTLFVVPSFVHAQQKTEYYQSVFSSWGVKTERLDFYNPSASKDPLLVVASEFHDDIKEIPYSAIFVCDVVLDTEDFYCDTESASGVGVRKVLVYEDPNENYEVSVYNMEIPGSSNSLTLIPEINLYAGVYREALEEYFTDIGDALSSDNNTGLIFPSVGSFVESFKLEYLIYVLGFAYLVLLSGALMKAFSLIKEKGWATLLDSLVSLLSRERWFLFYLIVLQIIGYIPILALISLSDRGGIDLKYISIYFLDNLDIVRLPELVGAGYNVRAGLHIYNFFILASLTLFLLHDLVSLTGRAAKYFIKMDFSPLKNLPILKTLAIIGSLLSVILLNAKTTSVPIIFFVILLVYINLGQTKGGIKVAVPFRLLTLIVATATIIVVGAPEIERLGSKEINLIDGESGSIILPHVEEIRVGKKFNDQLVAPDFPLFVDDYLVYYPGYHDIKNTSIELMGNIEDTNQESFVIIPAGFESLARYILRNEENRKAFYTEEFSPYILFSDFSYRDGAQYSLSLSVDCSVTNHPATVLITIYYFKGINIGKDEINALEFPGCGDLDGAVEFKLPWFPEYAGDGALIVRVRNTGITEPEWVGIELRHDNTAFTKNYLKFEEKDFLFSNITESQSLSVYGFGQRELSFSSQDGKLDIGSLLNRLIEEGLVKGEVKLWTVVPGWQILRAEDNEK